MTLRASFLVALLCGTGALCTGTLCRAEGVDRVSTTLTDERPSSPTIEEILHDWELRRTQLPSGEMDWKLVSQKRSESYGSVPNADASDGAGNDSSGEVSGKSVRVRFDSASMQITGTSVTAIRFGKPALPDASGWESNRQFLAVLNSRFTDNQIQPLQPLPYTVFIDRKREIHFWKRPDDAARFAVIFGPGQTGTLQLYSSMIVSHLPLLCGLIEPLRAALRPDLLLASETTKNGARILSQRPLDLGTPCLAVEFPLDRPQQNVVCRLWLNPSQGYNVVRLLLLGKNQSVLARYDIDYDRDAADHWTPQQMTILQFNSFGDVYDEVYATRQAIRLNGRAQLRSDEVNPRREKTPHPASPRKAGARSNTRTIVHGDLDSSTIVDQPDLTSPGLWVIDQADGKQYVVEKNGARRRVSLATALAQISPDESSKSKTFQRRLTWYSAQMILVRLVTWPGILLTLATLYLMRRFGRFTKRGTDLRTGASTTVGSRLEGRDVRTNSGVNPE